MKSKIIRLFLFVVCFYNLQAQQTSDLPFLIKVLKKTNESLDQIKNGKFNFTLKFKPLTATDTSTFKGSIEFYKDSLANKISKFIIYLNNSPRLILEDDKLYQIFNDSKKIILIDLKSTDLVSAVSGNINQFLVPVSNFNLDKQFFDEINAHEYEFKGIFRLNNSSVYLINKINYDSNNLATNIIEKFFLDTATNMPVKIIKELDFRSDHQYIEYELSEIGNIESKTTSLFNNVEYMDYKIASHNSEKFSSNETQASPLTFDKLKLKNISTIEGEALEIDKCKSRFILIDFWYKSCYPCQLAIPKLNRLNSKFKSNELMVLGVNPYDKDSTKLLKFIEENKIEFPVNMDTQKNLKEYFGVKAFPSLFLIDCDKNKIIYSFMGYDANEFESIEKKIRSLLKF